MMWRLVIILFLGICNLALFARMVWSPAGIVEYRALKDRYQRLQADVTRLDQENMELSQDIRLLQTDAKYVEKMVRQKLHYLRDNEMVYIFTKKSANENGATGNDRKN